MVGHNSGKETAGTVGKGGTKGCGCLGLAAWVCSCSKTSKRACLGEGRDNGGVGRVFEASNLTDHIGKINDEEKEDVIPIPLT